jgi:O-antigen ligase
MENLPEEPKKNFYTLDKFFYFILALVVPIFMAPYVNEPMTQKYGFTSIIYFLIVLFLSIRVFRSKKDYEINFPIQWIAWLLLSLTAIISIIPATRINLNYSFHTFEVSIFLLASMVISLHIINFSNKRNIIEWILMLFIVSGFLVALDALTNFYSGYDFFLNQHFPAFSRATVKSTIGNPNFVSDYLASLIPITLYFIIYKGKYLFNKFDKYVGLSVRLFMMVNVLFYLSVIMISQTRGTWLAAMIGWGVFLLSLLILKFRSLKFQYNKTTFVWVLIFVALVISVALLYSGNNALTRGKVSVTKRFSTINSQFLSAETDTSKQRIMAWTSAWREFKMSPILGTGVGTYKYYTNYALGDIQKDKPTFIASWKNYNRAHNDYIQTLSEMGILGFLALLFIIVTLVYGFFKVLFRETDSEKLMLFLLLVTAALVSTIHSTVSFPLHLSPNSLLYTVLLSIIFGKFLYPSKKIKLTNKQVKVVILIILIVIMIPAMYAKTAAWTSEALFVKGNIDLQYSQSYYQAFSQSKNRNYAEQSIEHYRNAYNEFQRSIKWDPAFGKTYFYIGNLTSAQIRYNTFLNKSRTNLSVLRSDKRLYSFIEDYLKDPIDNEISVLKNNTKYYQTLSYLRIFVDSTNAWLTSLNYLVDKNTFRILGQRYSTLASLSYNLYNSYKSAGYNDLAKERLNKAYEYSQRSIYYLDKAVYIMPGWRNLKDWWDFYNIAFEVSLTDYDLENRVHNIDPKYKPDVLPFIANLSRMRIWVGDEMKIKNDIDSIVFKYLPRMPKSIQDEIVGLTPLPKVKVTDYDILKHRPSTKDNTLLLYNYKKYYNDYSLIKQSEILDKNFNGDALIDQFKKYKAELDKIVPEYTKLVNQKENSAYTIGNNFDQQRFLKLQNTKNSLTNKLNSTIDSILRYRAFYVGSYYYFPKTRAVKFSSDPDLNQYVKSYMSKYFGYNLSDNDIKNYMGQFYINKGLSAFKDSKTQILKANDTLEKIIKLY